MLRLAGGPGPGVGGRLALVATNEGNGQLGQNKRSDSQFDGPTEFLGLSFVGRMGGAKRGWCNIEGFLEWCFAGNGDWPYPFTYECWKLRHRKEITGDS